VAVPASAGGHKQPDGAETILLVEDEDQVRSLARLVLERKGYHVLVARDGSEALRLLQDSEGSVQLLATDVVMPNMSGPELAGRVALMAPKVKVLYMSGYMDDAVGEHGLIAAGVPFLQKPYTPTALAQKVREVLDSGGPTAVGRRPV
jgi:CheY-like chemotaxis protein